MDSKDAWRCDACGHTSHWMFQQCARCDYPRGTKYAKRPRMESYPVDALDRAIMEGRLIDINDLPEGVDPDCFQSSGEVNER